MPMTSSGVVTAMTRTGGQGEVVAVGGAAEPEPVEPEPVEPEPEPEPEAVPALDPSAGVVAETRSKAC